MNWLSRCVASSNVWAVGLSGTIRHFDGTTWRDAPIPGLFTNLFAVWGTSDRDVWVAGDGGRILHFDGSTWSDTATFGTHYGIWGTGPRDIWVVGDIGTLFSRYTGESWFLVTQSSTSESMLATWGSRRDDVWAVGQNGVILHGTK